jgi:hypothetical protein
VYLADVSTIFGDKWQYWNQEYHSAQQIFGDTITGMSIRSLIHGKHSTLYMDSVESTFGILQNGQELLQLLGYGVRDGRPHCFTYVILADRVHFSETGHSLMMDMLSKHALLSNAQREVRYSGEFHIQPVTPVVEPNTAYRLIIDNNSGTYAPSADDLCLVKALFQANFPDLPVEVYDREDPQLTRYMGILEHQRSKSSIGWMSCCSNPRLSVELESETTADMATAATRTAATTAVGS